MLLKYKTGSNGYLILTGMKIILNDQSSSNQRPFTYANINSIFA